MNEKLFLYFSEKIGSAEIDGREYAYCHPMKLEINKKGDVIVACTVVDKEGIFYDLWLSWADFCLDNWNKLVIKRIGKYEKLPVKNIEEIISYLERRGIFMKVKDIPNGSILWKGNTILGIKGANLSEKYFEYDCYQEQGNPLDYTIITKEKLRELKNKILKGSRRSIL